jgi:hypothetical protein
MNAFLVTKFLKSIRGTVVVSECSLSRARGIIDNDKLILREARSDNVQPAMCFYSGDDLCLEHLFGVHSI